MQERLGNAVILSVHVQHMEIEWYAIAIEEGRMDVGGQPHISAEELLGH